jgi:hypothetical protein
VRQRTNGCQEPKSELAFDSQDRQKLHESTYGKCPRFQGIATTALLDSLTLTRKDLPGLDPDSGEIPDIPLDPAPASPATGKPRKPRNTVFDDRGAPAAGTAG